MKLIEIKSQLVFHRSERVGILFLLVVLLGLLYVQFFVSFSEESTFNVNSEEVLAMQQQLDSIRRVDSIKKLPKIYPFNPNYLTDYKAYSLGISPQAFDLLKAFRKKNQWVNSARQFQTVTGISDSILNNISPYFKFPDWVTRPKSNRNYDNNKRSLSSSEKIDLNKATSLQLQEVYGVGQVLGDRIVKQRDRLGSFHHEVQLYTVWGLRDTVVGRIMERFTVKTPTSIVRMNIDQISASDLSTLPGVSFELAKQIWEFVRVRDGLTDLSDLLKIEEISPRRLQVFRLYLYVE